MKFSVVFIFLFYSTFQVDCISEEWIMSRWIAPRWNFFINSIRKFNNEAEKIWEEVNQFHDSIEYNSSQIMEKWLSYTEIAGNERFLLSSKKIENNYHLTRWTSCNETSSCIEREKGEAVERIKIYKNEFVTCIKNAMNNSRNLSGELEKLSQIKEDIKSRVNVEDKREEGCCYYTTKIVEDSICLDLRREEIRLSVESFKESTQKFKKNVLKIVKRDSRKVYQCRITFDSALQGDDSTVYFNHKCPHCESSLSTIR